MPFEAASHLVGFVDEKPLIDAKEKLSGDAVLLAEGQAKLVAIQKLALGEGKAAQQLLGRTVSVPWEQPQTLNPLTPRRTQVSPFTEISILF